MYWVNWSELHTPRASRLMYLVAGSLYQPNWTADYRDLSHQLLTSCSQLAVLLSAQHFWVSSPTLHEWIQGMAASVIRGDLSILVFRKTSNLTIVFELKEVFCYVFILLIGSCPHLTLIEVHVPQKLKGCTINILNIV